MSSCEHCTLLEDLVDINSGNIYVVNLGYVFDSEPCGEGIVIVPKSQLERYKRGDYGWQVIESEQLPQNGSKSEVMEAIARIWSKYGINLSSNVTNMTHKERVEIANSISRELIRKPYVDSLFLTGSTALGQDRSDSDIDILVVLGSCPGDNKHKEMGELAKRFHSDIELYYMLKRDVLKAQKLQYPLIKNISLITSG